MPSYLDRSSELATSFAWSWYWVSERWIKGRENSKKHEKQSYNLENFNDQWTEFFFLKESKPCSVIWTLASSKRGFTWSTKILDADFFPPNGFTKTNSRLGRPVKKRNRLRWESSRNNMTSQPVEIQQYNDDIRPQFVCWKPRKEIRWFFKWGSH